MEETIKSNKTEKIKYMNSLKNQLTLKKSPTSSFNHDIYRRTSSTKIDLEKIYYESELILEEDNYQSESMFPRKDINIFKFFHNLFDPIDYLYSILGLIGCMACGFSEPTFDYISSDVYSEVGNTSEDRDSEAAEEEMKIGIKETMNSTIKRELIYGSLSFAGNFLGYFFIGLVSTRSLYKFKKNYFRLILSQEQGWFDSSNAFEFATKIQAQLEFLEQGIGEGLLRVLIQCFIFVGYFIFGFLGSWKLNLVLYTLSPLIFLFAIYMNKLNVKGNFLVRQTWESAGGIAEEIFYNLKTVISFSNFDYELKRFIEKVELSNNIELKVNFKIRLLYGILMFLTNSIVFLGFLYGRTLIQKDFNSFRGRDLTGGDIILTFYCVLFSLGVVAETSFNFQYVQLGLSATSDYFNLCERIPEMDLTYSKEKPPLNNINGNIEFKNVKFYYPSDINKKMILDGINIKFESGKKIALIGESGCGKTTIVNLIERLYDIIGGEIIIDGLPIYKYDIQYLRNLIGYVEQEPVIFNRSIRDNIIFGREQYLRELGEDIDQLVKDACDDSYVSEFIENLPKGLDYKVGLKGNKISGGQKQRIAIARAILIKPKILILDEATSALDNKSEKIVQKALDNISKKNITTIIIAHRLSTIKNSDLIYALKDGKIIEQGTHEELLNKNGYYADKIRPQLVKEELENYNKQDEYIRKITSIKRVNTDEEVHFENKVKELYKSPDNISLKIGNIIKEFLTNKLDFILAFLSCIILGFLVPFKGWIIAKGIVALNSNFETIRYDNGLKYSIIYLIVGFFDGIIYFLTYWKFFELGINISKSYRKKMMKKYLSFHYSYFDIDDNSPSSLLSKISTNTIQIKEFVFYIIGISIICITSFISSLIIGCIIEYRLTLIVMTFVPFIIFITFMRRFAIQSDSKKSIEAGIEGDSIISECVTSSKTIFSYNFQNEAIRLYLEAIDYITQQQIRDNFISALIIGIMFFSTFLSNATLYAATKKYVLNNTLDTDDMSIIQSIVWNSLYYIIVYMRDFGRVKKTIVALKSIYSVLETDSLIPSYEIDNCNKISANDIKGKIEFKHVYFAYPTHPEHVILKDICLTIMPGEKVALVGYSGCGKSSVIQLLNRFYDVEDGKGEILIDDINIKNYNLYELRKKIGFVSQEPSIFKTSSIENIRYGNLKATDDKCKEAAKEANALKILENEEGNNLKKKSALSGGEKQRLAISRIFLKNPVILLLDEVTSALDKKSELEVQKSLDKLSINKTTITIAHRLNTIENSNKIFVFDNGRIVEQGVHKELMDLKKRYYTLYKYSNQS